MQQNSHFCTLHSIFMWPVHVRTLGVVEAVPGSRYSAQQLVVLRY
jgi:hypothetical protein